MAPVSAAHSQAASSRTPLSAAATTKTITIDGRVATAPTAILAAT